VNAIFTGFGTAISSLSVLSEFEVT